MMRGLKPTPRSDGWLRVNRVDLFRNLRRPVLFCVVFGVLRHRSGQALKPCPGPGPSRFVPTFEFLRSLDAVLSACARDAASHRMRSTAYWTLAIQNAEARKRFAFKDGG